ncbi:MAG: NHLP bacteriocin export ABC transporter permease/ATPase subunit [Magnetovibrio sp.]|nr:NHLP bacteriocin export ABC transporter permease/ATPase subunit [Magnetovibrio sp.]
MEKFLHKFDDVAQVASTGSDHPLTLEGADRSWIVAEGNVDVFLTGLDPARKAVGARVHIARTPQDGVLLGMDFSHAPDDTGAAPRGYVAVGVPGTKLLEVPLESLLARAADPQDRSILSGLINHWTKALLSRVIDAPPPARLVDTKNEKKFELKAQMAFRPQGESVWIEQQSGTSTFVGDPEFGEITPGSCFPLHDRSWIVAQADGEIESTQTENWLARSDIRTHLNAFNAVIFNAIKVDFERREIKEINRLKAKQENDIALMDGSIRKLADVVQMTKTPEARSSALDPLFIACQCIGKVLDITFVEHPDAKTERGRINPLSDIAKASRVRSRKVVLKGEWWTKDHGPLLVHFEEDDRPAALIWGTKEYALHDATHGKVTSLTAELADDLKSFAYMFYRPFSETALSIVDVMKFGAYGSHKDIMMVAGMGLAGGLMGLVTPLATGMLFDSVIPGAAKGQLLQLFLTLISAVLAISMFQLTRGIAMLRIEGRMDITVQSAVWDRLLALPVPFFRKYSSGDLAMRANGISAIRQALSGRTAEAILSAIFSIFNLALLFYYDSMLALVACALVVLALTITITVSIIKLGHERKLATLDGKIAGQVLQLLSGVSKLRITGAEGRAFSRWADKFTEQRAITFKAENIANVLETFNSIFPLACSMTIFGTMAFYFKGNGLSTGEFLAFNAAFTSFLTATLSMTGVFVTVLAIIPMYERAKPILETLPEVSEAKANPGHMAGEIEVNHLTFSYSAEGPVILKGISLHIEPGQFVAFVGSSGSGKSTLLRCLLGFEKPDSGSIYYDGQDLAGLDITEVRRQLGVVLQNGQLMAGDIFSNIVGSLPLTIKDAEDAARMCGLDKDIEDMLMGMHTLVSESGGLSGGQRQRLLIARAIVNRPRILYFDEATSALDNKTQAIVSASLDKLEATRVVVAHRLSTIVNADKIFVLDNGEVIQQGTYDELMQQDGLFSVLAKRQIA